MSNCRGTCAICSGSLCWGFCFMMSGLFCTTVADACKVMNTLRLLGFTMEMSPQEFDPSSLCFAVTLLVSFYQSFFQSLYIYIFFWQIFNMITKERRKAIQFSTHCSSSRCRELSLKQCFWWKRALDRTGHTV